MQAETEIRKNMKRNYISCNLYDSTCGYSYEEYLEYCEGNDIKPSPMDSMKFYEWCGMMRDWDWDDFKSNMEYSKYANMPCMITGKLGLWNGTHDIKPEKENNLMDAIIRCYGSCNDIEVNLKDGYLEVNAYHHDGANCFEIHLLSKKGIERVECAERNWDDYDIKPYWFKKIAGYLY